ncbi:MAG TPA: long-chain fatty acid--CoA ligase [Acidocella sp.]|jgi:long-chain acyl-CoA synthetase|nr:long-chain fatty acid--CoA ligase [Acidocella sp.]
MDGQMAPDHPASVFVPPHEPAFTLLDTAVRHFGTHIALDFLGRRYSYAELGRLTNRAAAGLQKLGVAKGVKVGLCLPNCPYFVIMYYAILKTGGTVVNFNPLYTEDEIAAQARETETSLIVSLDVAAIQGKIARLVARGLFSRVIVCSMTAAMPRVKGQLFRLLKQQELANVPHNAPYMTFETLSAGTDPLVAVHIDPGHDIAVLQSTGGTTGIPKAAMLTHTNIVANVRQAQAAMDGLRQGQERVLAVLPFFHVFAMTAVMNFGLSIGAELLLLPKLDLKLLMQTLRRRRPTLLPGVPTLFTALCNAGETAPRGDFASVKFGISGGAPIAGETVDRFERLTRRPILEGYGLSEASPVVSFNRAGASRRGSVGQAVAGTVIEIRNPDRPEEILPQGAHGEICVRGPQVMRGYYKRPAETAQVFVEGALRTGDIGYLDAEGYLFIVDRIKDLIFCGGYNVYPRVIEEAAYQHPAVQDAVAIGVPDDYRGQSPKLFVTLRPGASATAQEILAYLQQHLNKIECPKSVEIRESLPRTLVGKLSKKELVAEEIKRATEG